MLSTLTSIFTGGPGHASPASSEVGRSIQSRLDAEAEAARVAWRDAVQAEHAGKKLNAAAIGKLLEAGKALGFDMTTFEADLGTLKQIDALRKTLPPMQAEEAKRPEVEARIKELNDLIPRLQTELRTISSRLAAVSTLMHQHQGEIARLAANKPWLFATAAAA